MEAVPRLPMLKVNMKDNQEYSGADWMDITGENMRDLTQNQIEDELKRHIRECYSDDPEKYRDCIAKFLELHLAAYKVIPAPDFDGCNTLKKYFGQLHYMQSRFPFTGENALKVMFGWGDAFSGGFMQHNSFTFEQAAIVFNIGACHSILGQMDNRVSEEGTKTSCVHFQCSAGMFQYLSDNLDTTLSYDSSQLMLKLMINTMLGQGQECLLEKSMQDNRKDSIVAKISQQVVDYYKVALTSLNSAEAKDIMGDSLNKSWLKLISFKTAFYAAIARYYAGCSSWDQERYGEGVGYLVSALQYYEQAVKAAKSLKGDVKNQVEKALKYSSDIFNGRYSGAKKDNEFIYHERVVDAALLPDIKGASLVKALPFEPSNQMVTGPDIFAKLIPMEAHLVASSYSEEKAKLLRPIVTEQDEKDTILEQYKQSIELDPDKLIKLDDADQLDPVLIEHCASLSVDQTPITKLTSSMKELSDLYMDVETVIEETIEIIEDEELETNQVKDVCGKTVDSSDEVSKIKADLEVCKDVHKEAWKINDDLSTAMKVHIANLRTVSRGLDAVRKECQLMDISDLLSEEDRGHISVMEQLCRKVREMEDQRRSLVAQLRSDLEEDDVTSTLMTRPGVEAEDLFQDELKKHDTRIGYLMQNFKAQENILDAVTEANVKYARIRKIVEEHAQKVNSKSGALLLSCTKYEKAIQRCKEGSQFFTELLGKSSALKERIMKLNENNSAARKKIMEKHEAKKAPPRPSAPKPKLPPVGTKPQPSIPATLQDLGDDIDEFNDPAFLRFLQMSGGLPAGMDLPSVPPSPTNQSEVKIPRRRGTPNIPQPAPHHLPTSMHQGMVPNQRIVHFNQPPPNSSFQNIPVSFPQQNSLPSPTGSTIPSNQISKNQIYQDYISQSGSIPSATTHTTHNINPSLQQPMINPETNQPMHYQPYSNQQGFQPPNNQQGFQPPNNQQGFQPPNNQQNNQQGYQPPNNQQGFQPPNNQQNNQQGFQPPTNQQGFQPPNNQQGFQPPNNLQNNQQGYQPPNNQQGFQTPNNQQNNQQGFQTPTNQQGFQPPNNQQGYQPPNNQQGLRPSNNQQGFQTPNNQQGFQTPNNQQGFQPPNNQQEFQPPNNQQGFQPPNNQQGLQPPNNQQGFQPPNNQQGFQPPNNQQGFQPSNNQQGFQPPNNQQGFQPPNNQQGYQPPNNQQGFQTPNNQQRCQTPTSYIGQNQQLQGSLPQQPINTEHQRYVQQPQTNQQQQTNQQPQNNQQMQQNYLQHPQNYQQTSWSNAPVANQTTPSSSTYTPTTMPLNQQLHHPGTSAPNNQPYGQVQPNHPSPSPHQQPPQQRHQQQYQPANAPPQTHGQMQAHQHHTQQFQTPKPAPPQQPQMPSNYVQPDKMVQQPQIPSNQPQTNQMQTPKRYPSTQQNQPPQQPYPNQYAPQNIRPPPNQQQSTQITTNQIHPGQHFPHNQQPHIQHSMAPRQNLTPNQPNQSKQNLKQHHHQPQMLKPTNQPSTLAPQPAPPTQPSHTQPYNQQGHKQRFGAPLQTQHHGQQSTNQPRPLTPAQRLMNPHTNVPLQPQTPVQPGNPRVSTPQPYQYGYAQQPANQSANPQKQPPNQTGQYQQPTPTSNTYRPQHQPYGPNQPQHQTNQQLRSPQRYPTSQSPAVSSAPMGNFPFQQPNATRNHQNPQITDQNKPYSNQSPMQPLVPSSTSQNQTTTGPNQLTPNTMSAPLQPTVVGKQKPEVVAPAKPSQDLAGLTYIPHTLQHTLSSTSADELLSGSPEPHASPAHKPVLVPVRADDESTVVRRIDEIPYKGEADLMQFKTDTEAFYRKIQSLLVKTPGSLCQLDKDWKQLSEQQEKHSRQLSTAIGRCSSYKNRFQDILPFDQSRIVLTESKDDYINASLVDGISCYSPRFIATQSPLPASCGDFWLMVHEQQVNLIVMLVSKNDIPKRCAVYWPEDRNVAQKHGSLSVTFTTSRVYNTYIERTFTLKHAKSNLPRSVTQLQYTAWPEHGLPASSHDLLSFMHIVYTFHSQQRSLQWPIIVHCENGVGHTGTFCSSYSSIQEMDAGLGIPDLLNIVQLMRKKRKFMVQEKAQLKFIHDLVYLHAVDLLQQRGVQVDTKPVVPPSPTITPQASHQHNIPTTFDVFGNSALSSIKASVERMNVKPEKTMTPLPETILPNESSTNIMTSLPPPAELIPSMTSQTHSSNLDSLLGSNVSDLVQGTMRTCDVTNAGQSTEKLPFTNGRPDLVRSCKEPETSEEPTKMQPFEAQPLVAKPEQVQPAKTPEPVQPAKTPEPVQPAKTPEPVQPVSPTKPAENEPKEANISILDQLTPESFTLGAPESKDKKRITKADFYAPREGLGPKKGTDDPFGDLDPMWGLKN